MSALTIASIAIFVTLISTLIQKKLTDVDLVKSLKAEAKKISKDMKAVRQDAKKVNELMSKSFEIQKKMMGQTMKPMMISSVVILIAFFIISSFFSEVVLGLPFSLPFLGNQLSWFWIFFFSSLGSGLIFRKVLDMGF